MAMIARRPLTVTALAVIACTTLVHVSARRAAQPSPAIEFVAIAPGEFVMGCAKGDNDCNADEKPAHKVSITKAFEIGKYEVTQAQWRTVMGANPATIKGDERPVETVGRTDAMEFIGKLNARNDGYRYRLPTEAEWEYAARAGATGASTGPLGDVAWYADNSGDETHAVGTKKPNAWGLYDMQGNVREWVSDNYSRTYYSSSPAADPPGPATAQGGARAAGGGRPGGAPAGRGGQNGRGGPGQLGVMRGGAWDTTAPFARLSSRYNYYGPTLRVSDVGVRLVREAVSR
jgi:formylglycine-generating enzyme required for sulfatase activity